jgi:hypothetical protein
LPQARGRGHRADGQCDGGVPGRYSKDDPDRIAPHVVFHAPAVARRLDFADAMRQVGRCAQHVARDVEVEVDPCR